MSERAPTGTSSQIFGSTRHEYFLSPSGLDTLFTPDSVCHPAETTLSEAIERNIQHWRLAFTGYDHILKEAGYSNRSATDVFRSAAELRAAVLTSTPIIIGSDVLNLCKPLKDSKLILTLPTHGTQNPGELIFLDPVKSLRQGYIYDHAFLKVGVDQAPHHLNYAPVIILDSSVLKTLAEASASKKHASDAIITKLLTLLSITGHDTQHGTFYTTANGNGRRDPFMLARCDINLVQEAVQLGLRVPAMRGKESTYSGLFTPYSEVGYMLLHRDALRAIFNKQPTGPRVYAAILRQANEFLSAVEEVYAGSKKPKEAAYLCSVYLAHLFLAIDPMSSEAKPLLEQVKRITCNQKVTFTLERWKKAEDFCNAYLPITAHLRFADFFKAVPELLNKFPSLPVKSTSVLTQTLDACEQSLAPEIDHESRIRGVTLAAFLYGFIMYQNGRQDSALQITGIQGFDEYLQNPENPRIPAQIKELLSHLFPDQKVRQAAAAAFQKIRGSSTTIMAECATCFFDIFCHPNLAEVSKKIWPHNHNNTHTRLEYFLTNEAAFANLPKIVQQVLGPIHKDILQNGYDPERTYSFTDLDTVLKEVFIDHLFDTPANLHDMPKPDYAYWFKNYVEPLVALAERVREKQQEE